MGEHFVPSDCATEIAGRDLEVCQKFCDQNQVPLTSLFKLAWATASCVFQGESSLSSAAIDSSRDAESGQTIEFSIFRAELDSGILVSQSLGLLQQSFTDEIRSSSLAATLESLRGKASKSSHGDRLIFAEESPSESLPDPEDLQNQLNSAGLQVSALAVVSTVSSNGTILLRCRSNKEIGAAPSISTGSLARNLRQIILEIASSNSETRMDQLHVIGSAELGDILKSNALAIQSVDGCVHEMIDAYAAQHPDKQAIAYPGEASGNYSYARLTSTTNNLARLLKDLGVAKGDVVPSLFEKCPHSVLAILATIKAGAAYVGLNLDSPPDAMRQAVEVVGAKVVLASRKCEEIAALLAPTVLVIDDNLLDELERSGKATASLEKVEPSDAIFIALTSGSTGTPKAAVIEHRSVTSFAGAVRRKGWMSEETRALQFASAVFDAFVAETMVVMLAGGTVCVPTEDGRLNDLAGMIRTLEVNWFGATPSLCRTFSPSDVPGLKRLSVWGEANSNDVMDRWEAAVPMANVYGPAECTCASSINFYGTGSPGLNNVGPPLDCAAYWVVSPSNHNRLVPVGAIGELIIQGTGVARGYLNDPVKTKSVFIDSPEWALKDPRWNRYYKTGDLVKQLPDHSFEYIGRIDKQVKLNGQRLELGEVEEAVTRALGDNSAVAVEVIRISTVSDSTVPRAPSSSNRFLAAFIGPKCAQYSDVWDKLIDTEALSKLDIISIRRAALQQLRPFAVPRIFIPLRVIPVTSVGKINRKLLQLIGSNLDEQSVAQFSGTRTSGSKALQTPIELRLGPLFARVLKLNSEAMTSSSDFFLLGGDSIKAIELVKVAGLNELRLTVPMILLHPVLSDLASIVTASQDGPAFEELPYSPFDSIAELPYKEELLNRASTLTHSDLEIQDIFPATDYQASCVAWTTLKRRGAINWLVYEFQPSQSLEKVQQLCKDLVRNEGLLRTAFVPHRGVLYQAILDSFQSEVTILRHQPLRTVDDIQTEVVENDASRVVDIGQPQTAFVLLCGSDGAVNRVMIRLLHAQYDGQSVLILKQAMTDMLRGSYEPYTTATFPQYLHRARHEEREPGIAYWRQLLEGAQMTPLVPTKPDQVPIYLSFADGAIVRITPTTQILPPPGISVNTATFIQTAWALALSQATGCLDVIFGSTVWGRNAPFTGATQLIGSLLSHVPVRARIVPGETYEDLLRAIHIQRGNSTQFESIGANSIVQHCTSWNRWTRLSSLVVFQGLEIPQNLPVDIDGSDTSTASSHRMNVQLADEIVAPADRTDLLLHVEPQPDGTTRVILRFSTRRMSKETAETVMGFFLANVDEIARRPDQKIDDAIASRPSLFPKETGDDMGNQSSVLSGDRTINGVQFDRSDDSAESHDRLRAIVDDAWEIVLGIAPDELSVYRKENRKTMGIWGSLMSCAALANEYFRKGYDIATEDIMEAQSMVQQEKLLRRAITTEQKE